MDISNKQYNSLVTHITQSYQWGEFREKLGLKLIRVLDQDLAFELTLHKIPFLNKYFGYLPKGSFPNSNLADHLEKIAKANNCVAIKIEPNVILGDTNDIIDPRFKPSPKSLFTKHNFILDLTQSEEKLLSNMHPKTRYNIKVAQKNKVWVEERTDNEAFEIYLKLYFDTTKRQGYHGHNPEYHRLAWETLKKDGMARILIAFYTPPESSQKIPLTAWMLFNFKDTLYYPYGGSSPEYRNTQSSTLIAWEAIKLGKKLKLKKFDLWGALGPDASLNDPWQGFHRFKAGLGGELVEYIGSYDLVVDPIIYNLFNIVEHFQGLKFFLLKTLGK